MSTTTMKAYGVNKYGSVERLEEFDLPIPAPEGTSIVVKINAVSINPVDTKARSNFGGPEDDVPQPRVLGYDASGVVHAVGEGASLFKVGDEVFFSGSLPLNGTHAQYTLVDERIVGRKPASLSHEDAAALPLTMLTAVEGLFEGAGVPMRTGPDSAPASGAEKTLLVVGGAGGVGSSIIQVAKQMSAVPLRVIATASRPETRAWCERLGADLVVNHHNLKEELEAAGVSGVDYFFNTNDTAAYFDFAMEILNPTGALILINGTDQPLNIGGGMFKRIRVVWELMFSRALFNAEPEKQNGILNAVSAFVDAGKIVTTRNGDVVALSLDTLKAAHTRQDSGKVIGKQVLSVSH